MRKLIPIALVALALAGCATQKDYYASGGSRADGVVKMSYDWGGMDVPKVNEQQAVEIATQRCKAWGYTGAESFGQGKAECTGSDLFGCAAWRRTKEFQCTGTPAANK